MPTTEPVSVALDCAYFDAGRCRSCTLLPTPYERQLADQQARIEAMLPPMAWDAPHASAVGGFRNKAKMAVAGTVDAPTIGILAADGTGIDLQACPLHERPIVAAMPLLEQLVREARLTPYDVPSRRGELKHLILTASPDGELALRLVLRSSEAVPRIRKHLPLLAALPLASVSVNLQPEHKAVLEGDEELLLAGDGVLRMRVNDVPLRLRPRSFFQTNTAVAAALYRQATAWIDEADPASVLDLYCGVGGFALHAARPGRRVAGVEVTAEAIDAARESALELGADATFTVGDAGSVDLEGAGAPELVVVNPPRRGIGELAERLEASAVRRVVYSSCNPVTLARDLQAMPSLVPLRGRVFDMFPHTGHAEVLVELVRG
ncbi:methyltransferase domain-containing protein [Agrococcus sp. SCSIO52902]|uniref:methyltransferase domain-containing protein n=1 Tax=Agrococcus sp. SCSIO52902 TaxID=2933290 RepID=UPI001FF5576C|nr:methyltransferase domain-containing protein [Agrococcus sp. SCSIO52902]UOW01148.1 methyltransferase domain-containing protein [Agrococcus sp. SCSIO52902]